MFRSIVSLLFLANLGGIGMEEASVSDNFDVQSLIQTNPIPDLKAGRLAPDIKAAAAILIDNGTGLTLYEKNSDLPMPMASLTKIMTALLILENHSLDEIVTVRENFSAVEGVKIGLHKNEKIAVGELMKALLIRSAGDAAMALGEFHSGSVEAFVEQMNERAQTLNLTQTHFQNPIGLDAPDHYSSAHDLAILARYAMRMDIFRNIVRQKQATATSLDGFSYNLVSTNLLLNSYLDVLGVKTGTTDEAGESVINMARNDEGHEVLAVILDSPDRFQESKSMLDWAFRSHFW